MISDEKIEYIYFFSFEVLFSSEFENLSSASEIGY